MIKQIHQATESRLQEIINIQDKAERSNALFALIEELQNSLAEQFPESELIIKEEAETIQKELVRKMILERRIRLDGRKPDEIRPITCEIGLLPRTHGSALFTRGQTQALAVTTLGTKMDEQKMDELKGTKSIAFQDGMYTLLEFQVDMVMPGVDDPDGIAYPYIVTMDYGSNTVLSIRRNWREGLKRVKPPPRRPPRS